MQTGTQHWLRTLLGQTLRIGEHISQNGKASPDEETLKKWGEIVKNNSREIIDYFEGKDLEKLQTVKVINKYYTKKLNITFPLIIDKVSIDDMRDIHWCKGIYSIKQLKSVLNYSYKGIHFSSWGEDIWCSKPCKVLINDTIEINFK